MEVGRDRAHALLDADADAGGTSIDTADVYGDGRAEQWIVEETVVELPIVVLPSQAPAQFADALAPEKF